MSCLHNILNVLQMAELTWHYWYT